MKTKSIPIVTLSLLALIWQTQAQISVPTSREVVPSPNNSAVEPDGIVIDRGQAFLIRNGRAALINKALVPEGQLLTWEGRLVPLPSGFSTYDNTVIVNDGIMVFRGQAYVLHHGRVALINAAVVPDGQVLTSKGQLVPLPSDFSGFTLDRSHAGITPSGLDSDTQALSNQVGVPQVQQGSDFRPRTNASVSSSDAAANQASMMTNANGLVVNRFGAGQDQSRVALKQADTSTTQAGATMAAINFANSTNALSAHPATSAIRPAGSTSIVKESRSVQMVPIQTVSSAPAAPLTTSTQITTVKQSTSRVPSGNTPMKIDDNVPGGSAR